MYSSDSYSSQPYENVRKQISDSTNCVWSAEICHAYGELLLVKKERIW